MTERLPSPMKQLPLVTNPVYSYSFDQKHRFPMEKFGLLNQYLAGQHILSPSNVYRPGKARPELLQLAHNEDPTLRPPASDCASALMNTRASASADAGDL